MYVQCVHIMFISSLLYYIYTFIVLLSFHNVLCWLLYTMLIWFILCRILFVISTSSLPVFSQARMIDYLCKKQEYLFSCLKQLDIEKFPAISKKFSPSAFSSNLNQTLDFGSGLISKYSLVLTRSRAFEVSPAGA